MSTYGSFAALVSTQQDFICATKHLPQFRGEVLRPLLEPAAGGRRGQELVLLDDLLVYVYPGQEVETRHVLHQTQELQTVAALIKVSIHGPEASKCNVRTHIQNRLCILLSQHLEHLLVSLRGERRSEQAVTSLARGLR